MKVFVAQHFKRQLKKLMKTFPNVKADLIKSLEGDGLRFSNTVGKSIYKLRVASSDLDRGKSGGFRCYVYLYTKKSLLIPVCIYLRSKKDNLSSDELNWHLNIVLMEVLNQ